MIGFITSLAINSLFEKLRFRRKPKVIQLPITSRCNSRCVTCNVWKISTKVDISPEGLRKAFRDPFFSRVKAIGINGGELTLVKDLDDILDAVFSVKTLQYIHIISNGLLPDRLFGLLRSVKEKASQRGVKVGFTLSVDGYGHTHELTRGVPNCFVRTVRILDEFKDDLSCYCDIFNIGCTISTYNITHIQQVVAFLKQYPFKAYYHLAVPNKRIHTFNDANYYVLTDERKRLLAEEFFLEQYHQTSFKKNPIDKFRAFANYTFLTSNGKKRLAQCYYKYRDVTIDENLDLSYCATASDNIGNLNNHKPLQMINSKRGQDILSHVKENCSTCVHYSDIPTISGGFLFIKNILKERFFNGRQYK